MARQRRSATQWKRIVDDWARSGCTRRDFAREVRHQRSPEAQRRQMGDLGWWRSCHAAKDPRSS
jgi:hypothetical protein